MFIFKAKIYMLNVQLNREIKAAENMKPVVSFKHLLKDAAFENMITNAGLPVFLQNTRINLGTKYFHLPQYFPLTVMNTERIPERPFLLIPLFKILDTEGADVNYRYFEADNYNQIQVLPDGGPCYLGADRWPMPEDHTLILNIGADVKVDLSQSLFVNHNGYLIFKDHNSECAMVYVGVFIDQGDVNQFIDTKLGEIYKQYISSGKQEIDKIPETDIEFELEFNIERLQGRKVLDTNIQKDYMPEYDNKMGLHLNIPHSENVPRKLKVVLKGLFLNGQLSFEITKYLNNEIFDNSFFRLYFFDEQDARDYNKFVYKNMYSTRSQRILRTPGPCIPQSG